MAAVGEARIRDMIVQAVSSSNDDLLLAACNAYFDAGGKFE